MNVTMSGDYVKGCAETCGQLGRASAGPPAGPLSRPPPTGSSSFAVAPYGSVHLESEADPAARADD
ncbi:hypothetical protein [Streptomyces sp. NPDC057966]|uniref:hypothetical protein n=1 Tax=Streptomyces sp. NPDC057966 TaxID=3346292 RepID=UPI0036E11D5C